MATLNLAQFAGTFAVGGNSKTETTITSGHSLIVNQMWKDPNVYERQVELVNEGTINISKPNWDVVCECFDHNDNWFYISASNLQFFNQENIDWLESVKHKKAIDCLTQMAA